MDHKSERLKKAALHHGWKAQIVPKLEQYEKTNNPNDIQWHFYALRDKETIHVIYHGNRFYSGAYTYGGYRLNPARSGSVLKLLAGKPNPRKLERSEPEKLLETRQLPWSDNAPALDIMLAVLGKSLTWVRKIDGEVVTGYVDKATNVGKPYFKISETKTGRRILEWQNREGFHAVGIEQIIDVS